MILLDLVDFTIGYILVSISSYGLFETVLEFRNKSSNYKYSTASIQY